MAEDENKEWRCFFCDEVFTDRKSASEHFGCDETERCDPVCNWQKDLVRYILQLERENRAFQEDRDPVLLAWDDVIGQHAEALSRAEQHGYDKGVSDMKKQGYCVEPQKHV